MPPQFIYFDIDNVLLRFCNATAAKQLADLAGFEANKLRQALLGPTERESVQWQFERGDISVDRYIDHYRQVTGYAPDVAEFALAASDMFAPIDDSFALVRKLRAANHRLGVLSNTNPIHWEFMQERFDIFTTSFEQVCTSFGANAMKPEPAIYAQAIEFAGVPAEHSRQGVGVCRACAFESDTLRGEPVDGGRRVAFVTVTPHVVGAEGVNGEQKDVGAFRFFRVGHGDQEQGGKKEWSFHSAGA